MRNHLKKWQVLVLKEAFKKNELWTWETKILLGKKIGVNYKKVGKWHWDERKRLKISVPKNGNIKIETGQEQI